MHTFDTVVSRLFRQNEFAIKYDLGALRAAVDALALPRPARRVFIVAGTNGKGTTSAWLHALARASGRRVGLFTSPHLVDVRERIRVDGAPISRDAFASTIGELLGRFGDPTESRAGRALTYFELLTLGAWVHFAASDLDVAIFEVGLGGRLDATNLVDADVALLTALGLDHTEYLGNTLEAIASEKAAVARPGRVAWVHASHAGAIQARRALDQVGADTHVCPASGIADDPATTNAELAIAAWGHEVSASRNELERLALDAGRRVRWPGRRDVRHVGGRTWLLDGAHNPDAMALLPAWLSEHAPTGVDAVLGASPGRDVVEMFAPIASHLRTVHICPVSAFRSAEPADVATALRTAGVASVAVHQSAPIAFEACRRASSTGHPILVTGSLYLVGAWFDDEGFDAEDFVIDAVQGAPNRS